VVGRGRQVYLPELFQLVSSISRDIQNSNISHFISAFLPHPEPYPIPVVMTAIGMMSL
jgi:hypothetical protein